jgi:hypothetical protein
MPPTPAGSPFGLGYDERGAGRGARSATSTAQQSRSHATRKLVRLDGR